MFLQCTTQKPTHIVQLDTHFKITTSFATRKLFNGRSWPSKLKIPFFFQKIFFYYSFMYLGLLHIVRKRKMRRFFCCPVKKNCTTFPRVRLLEIKNVCFFVVGGSFTFVVTRMRIWWNANLRRCEFGTQEIACAH